MTTVQLVVVAAGVSTPSASRLLADRLTEATLRRLEQDGASVDVTSVELRELAFDIVGKMIRGFGSTELDELEGALRVADAAVMVTPIFTTSYSGLFKSFLDVLDPKVLTGLPILLGATGGTERHSLAVEYSIRPVFAYLHAIVMPTAVYAATGDWGRGVQPQTEDLSVRIDRAAAELAVEISRPDRERIARAPDPLALPAGFDPSGRSR